ncbi:MAG: hypothetical protein C5B48_00045 [Candidatus Rokuibacteriota bacterium]|nr:MAG: hypothetical protein C5B48_00045 [Candidatus Rokubacteria bacterium]
MTNRLLALTMCLHVTLSLVSSVPTATAADCREMLASNHYRCGVADEFGGTFEICLRADPTNFPPGKFKFDTSFAETYHCTCTPKGSLARPRFNEGSDFICARIVPQDLNPHLVIAGHVGANGAKITKGTTLCANHILCTPGQGVDSSFRFECTRDANC